MGSCISKKTTQTTPVFNRLKRRIVNKKTIIHDRSNSVTPKPEDILPTTITNRSSVISSRFRLPELVKWVYDKHMDIVIITNPNGIILYSNGAVSDALSYHPRELVHHDILDFVCDDYKHAITEFYKDTTKLQSRMKICMRRNASKSAWFDINMLRGPEHSRTERGNITIFLKIIQLEMHLGKLLNEMRKENQHLRKDIIAKVFPPYVMSKINSGNTDFLINHDNIIVGAFDIVGFTEKCVINHASFTILRPLYFEADRLCEKHNLCLIEIIGDAMIIAGNCTDEQKNSVEDVIGFMIDFINFCRNTTQLDIRAGIACGNAISGMIGYNQFRYHIFGTAVNTAARMEALSRHNSVRITSAVYKNIKDKEKYKIQSEKPVYVKGLGEMSTYTISGANECSPGRHKLTRHLSASALTSRRQSMSRPYFSTQDM